jgi:hypothetical protein
MIQLPGAALVSPACTNGAAGTGSAEIAITGGVTTTGGVPL